MQLNANSILRQVGLQANDVNEAALLTAQQLAGTPRRSDPYAVGMYAGAHPGGESGGTGAPLGTIQH